MTLEDSIMEVLRDGRPYNVRWIRHKLERLGESVTSASISRTCMKMRDEGLLEMVYQNKRSMEWRLV